MRAALRRMRVFQNRCASAHGCVWSCLIVCAPFGSMLPRTIYRPFPSARGGTCRVCSFTHRLAARFPHLTPRHLSIFPRICAQSHSSSHALRTGIAAFDRRHRADSGFVGRGCVSWWDLTDLHMFSHYSPHHPTFLRIRAQFFVMRHRTIMIWVP